MLTAPATFQGADAPATLTAANALATAGRRGRSGLPLANGAITFTPDGGFCGRCGAFNYTITDQDGDTSSSTLTVEQVAADSVPSLVVSTTNLTVDEDGFANAANDTVTARTDETASTGLLTQSGTAVVNFGSDVPANLMGSIVLVDTSALDGQLHTHDGQSVTFALVGAAIWLALARERPRSSAFIW